MSLLALVGYWLDESGRLRHGLLGLKRLFGVHSGQNQAELVWYMISQYQIENTLGYFTLDNASNNSTALRSIQSQLNQYKSPCSYSSIDTEFINNSRYIRCYGHVLNLIVKVFLYGKRSSKLIKDKAEKQTMDQENEQLEHWRKVGPLGKLRNITVWIHGSSQRSEAFCKVVASLLGKITNARRMILGNVTRWTGDFDGLERALLFRHTIDSHIQHLILQDPKCSISKDILTSDDWHILEVIFNFLKPFQQETLALEGHQAQGALFNIYPSLELLHKHVLKTQFAVIGQSRHLDHSFQLAREKITKYYSLSQLSPIICASIVLHPNMDNFFDDKELGWGSTPEWGIQARELVQRLWELSYKNLILHNIPVATTSSPKRNLNPSTGIRNFKKPRLTPQVQDDELTRYLSWLAHNDHEITNPINWWIEGRGLYPRLSILALDAFSVPAMSAECERIFSRY